MASESAYRPDREGMLSPYRVLDLTDERGILCGKILADLGADVIQIEPPGGSSARRVGPFYQDEPGPDSSLFWWSYAANKRSITLNLHTADGQALLKRLLPTADFLVESGPPRRTGVPGAWLCRARRDQPLADRRVHHAVRAVGSVRRLSGARSGWHRHGRLDVRHGRSGPPAGARRLSAFLPARGCRRGYRSDAGACPPHAHRRRAVR